MTNANLPFDAFVVDDPILCLNVKIKYNAMQPMESILLNTNLWRSAEEELLTASEIR